MKGTTESLVIGTNRHPCGNIVSRPLPTQACIPERSQEGVLKCGRDQSINVLKS